MASGTNEKNIRALVTFKEDSALLHDHTETVVTPQENVAVPESKKVTGAKNSLSILAEQVAQSSTLHQDSVLSDTPHGGESEGTIIRETKRKRFRLLPALYTASKEWVETKKTEYEKTHHPVHAIANADARKEVIEEAVRKSAVAPREDFKTVAERLKGAERKPIATGIAVKAKADLPKPQWASLTEAPEEKAVSGPEGGTEALVYEHTPEPRFTSVPETQTQSMEEVAPDITPVSIEKVEVPRTPYTEIAPQVSVPQEIATPNLVAQQNERVPQPKRDAPPVSQTYVQQSPRTLYNPQYFIIAFLIVAVLCGIGVSFLLFKPEDAPQQKAVVYTIPALINASQHGFTLPGNREALLGIIAEQLVTNNTVTQLYPTFTLQDGTQKPASSEQIFMVLNPRTSPSFNRNVPELTFGGAGQAPFILMKTQNFDTAFAGMLEWEKTMSADLSPLFGDTVVMTFDPSARTDTQVRDAFFKDTIASNKNVRLLLDEEGNDRIVYTFINQNTLLITTTRTALESLLPLIR